MRTHKSSSARSATSSESAALDHTIRSGSHSLRIRISDSGLRQRNHHNIHRIGGVATGVGDIGDERPNTEVVIETGVGSGVEEKILESLLIPGVDSLDWSRQIESDGAILVKWEDQIIEGEAPREDIGACGGGNTSLILDGEPGEEAVWNDLLGELAELKVDFGDSGINRCG